MKVKVYNQDGKSSSDISLPENVFGQPMNEALLAQAVHIYRYNAAKGTSHTKKKSEVHGGGRKPWRQKGTGRARHGSIRSPQWKGGGVVFGPRYAQKRLKALPQKMRRLALCSALSTKASAGQVVVVENMDMEQAKTKQAFSILNKLPITGNVLYMIDKPNDNTYLSFRNISSFRMLRFENINVFDLLKNGTLLLTVDGVKRLTEQFVDVKLKQADKKSKPAPKAEKSPTVDKPKPATPKKTAKPAAAKKDSPKKKVSATPKSKPAAKPKKAAATKVSSKEDK